ncbi:uncharacterized protein LOC103317987 isoform X2 [Nasonia vitripennis]|uniref:Uncharacterized protein n=1 Tax=Nasonia vitripennis TaxID=7425 RepID=A0A7M7HH71_NASVI|nr:uncharacterized protein LOC103317987 isoform X2 [Nasonia vitripennis]
MSQESESDISEMEGLVPKRRREFSSEDESLNLSKYRKLTTEQKLNDLKTEVTAADTSYESEEEDDESYVDREKKSLSDEIVPDSNKHQENSHSSNENITETNTPSTMEQEYQDSMETISESDVDSLEVSATEELNLLEKLRKPFEKVQRLAFISATYRISGRKMNTSQFSCNADVTVNGALAHNEVINKTIKRKNCALYEDDTTDEKVEANRSLNSCEETTGSDNIELEKVAKSECVNSQDLADTQIMDNILEPDNIKTEIASQVTVPAYVDFQNVEKFSENIDSESRKSVSENINSENSKAISEDVDSAYENAASENVDYENEKNLAQDVEKEPAVIENVDTTNGESVTMTSHSENMPVLLINSNFNNGAQTESMDVETSGTGNTEMKMNFQTTEPINQTTEAPKSNVNECFASENTNHPRINETEQEAAILNLLSHANFDITDGNQVVSEVIIPENAEEIYTEPNNSSNAPTYEHSYQDPSTSGVVEEVFTDASRANSDLAQLVLSIKQDIQELTKKVDKQGNVLEAVVNANEINLTPLFAQTFQEKYNLQLPFTKIEDFDKFNQDLAKNTRFCNEFITSLCSYIDNNVTLAKNILNMLRKYMSKELATLYTACKATGNKMVLKDTLFCKCLLQATKLTIRNGLLPLEHEKAFLKNLGLVVSGAKNWVTHEDERRKSS